MSYYFTKTRCPKWASNLSASSLYTCYNKAEIAEEDALTLAKDYFSKLDQRFGLDSDKFNYVLSSKRLSDDSNSKTQSVLSSCSCRRSKDDIVTITIYPDALNKASVFYDTLRHEYSHALADEIWIDDADYEPHSEHGVKWQECCSHVGCSMKSTYSGIGKHFTHVIQCKCGRVLYYATSLQDAEDKLANTKWPKCKDCKGQDKEIVSGDDVFNVWKKEQQRMRAEYNYQIERLKKKAEENKRRFISSAEDEIHQIEHELSAIQNSCLDFATLLSHGSSIEIEHASLGSGHVIDTDDTYVDVVFDSGRHSTFTASTFANSGLIHITNNEYLERARLALGSILNAESDFRNRLIEAYTELKELNSLPADSYVFWSKSISDDDKAIERLDTKNCDAEFEQIPA